MQNSIATMHFKNLEGYGYAIIESLSSGRPVIMHRSWVKDKTYNLWCHEGQSVILVSTVDECVEQIGKLVNNEEYRHSLQDKSAKAVRAAINNQEQTEKLQKYLEGIL